jgi:urate oxidase
MADGFQLQGRHGKSRVRVSRVWRRPAAAGGDVIVEWNVAVSVVSDCLPSYNTSDNSAIVATDSIKNTVSSYDSPFPFSSSRRPVRHSRLADCVRLSVFADICEGQGVH